jgi:hypothetical protein
MMNHGFAYRSLFLSLLCACSSGGSSETPDGRLAAPIEAIGTFSLRSNFSLSAPPPGPAQVLAELAAATDGPDDPSRYLVDKLVAKLDGRTQLAAAAVAPYVAAYLQARIDTFAPELTDKLRMLADGVNQIGRRFGTTETLTIDDAGHATHVITGVGFDASGRAVDIAFAPLGMADVAMHTSVTIDNLSPGRDRVVIGEHAALVPYGAVLRLGLDRVVVPHVVQGALDLGDAFVKLVDCNALGAHVSDYLGVGSADLYAGACTVALMHLAAEIYDRLDAPPVQLDIAGSARAIDADGDGPMDQIVDGNWTGSFAALPLGSSDFQGTAR